MNNEYSDFQEEQATNSSQESLKTEFIVTFSDAVDKDDESPPFTENNRDWAEDVYHDAIEVAYYDNDVTLVEIKLIERNHYRHGIVDDLLLSNT